LQFTDKTVESGIFHPLTGSFGLSWGDIDKDGYMDAYIRNHSRNPSLYRNWGAGTFEDITFQLGIITPGDFQGASWGDFDNDADVDLYQALGSPWEGKVNYLYRNDSASSIFFNEIAEPSGVANPDGRGRAPVWFDYDMDGYLDLLICNLAGQNIFTKLYRNNEDQTFVDVTEESGIAGIGPAYGASVGDYDNDDDLDIFFSRSDVALYRNNGNGAFEDVSGEAGLKGIGDVRDTAIADYDNDGDLDLYLVRRNTSEDAYETVTDALYYAVRILKNSEKGFTFGASSPSVAFYIYKNGSKENQHNIFIGQNSFNSDNLFENLGDGTFHDVTDQAGVDDPRQGQSAIWAAEI
jgi:hypothetical protein